MSYKRLGDYIEDVNIRNKDLEVKTLLGVSIKKCFISSIANTIGSDMSKYKIVEKNQFAYGPITSRNGDKISVALLKDYDKAIISQAYKVFKVDEKQLLPDYLMMWMMRPEFDRYARFKSHGSTREAFDWDELCDVELPIPSIEKQQEIVNEYHTVVNRIKLNEQLNTKLEETAQALYKHWFVDFEFPNKNGKPYKSSGGEMVYNEVLDKDIPMGWSVKELQSIANVTSGKTLRNKGGTKHPVYGAGGVVGYSDDFLFEGNVVITGRVGTHGKVFIEYEKVWCTDNTLVFKSIYMYYNYFILKCLNYDELNKGGVQALLTQKDLKEYNILTPNFGIKVFEKEVKIFFIKIDINKKQNQTLRELASLLLARMGR